MLRIKKVNRCMTNRRIFRTIARDNCGESMEPSEDEIIYFGYQSSDTNFKGDIIACGSLKLCNANCIHPDKNDYYHWISFIFIKRGHKSLGYGRQLVEYMEIDGWNMLQRPFRVDSASKAVPFFEKCGYKQIEDPRECVCGSLLFKYLYLMEKEYEYKEESWDD